LESELGLELGLGVGVRVGVRVGVGVGVRIRIRIKVGVRVWVMVVVMVMARVKVMLPCNSRYYHTTLLYKIQPKFEHSLDGYIIKRVRIRVPSSR
jgi:hypothetical protein